MREIGAETLSGSVTRLIRVERSKERIFKVPGA